MVCDNGLRCEGVGPNKKLAKRAAAEAVLSRIGYVKPMPKPGKSLLKKKPDDYVQWAQIGRFFSPTFKITMRTSFVIL